MSGEAATQTLPERRCPNCKQAITALYEHAIPNFGWSCHYRAGEPFFWHPLVGWYA